MTTSQIMNPFRKVVDTDTGIRTTFLSRTVEKPVPVMVRVVPPPILPEEGVTSETNRVVDIVVEE